MAGERPRVLLIGGPTASGKTDLAVQVAQRWGAAVVSADAMQVYRGMDIGTAKPTEEERGGVPHLGFDMVNPDQPFDVADFLAVLDEACARHERVIVAGGTGLYLRAAIRGVVATPRPDPARRVELEAASDLHDRLSEVDPELAGRLHPRDRVRLIRGLEVWEQTGRRLSALQREHAEAPDRIRWAGVFLDRDDLDARIDARVLAMMARGYLDEVRGLLEAGYGPELKPMRSLGYRHLAEHLRGGLELDEAVRRTQRDTRRFARKQRTWQNTLGFEAVQGPGLEVTLDAAERLWGEG